LAKTYACADLGMDCDWTVSGNTEDEVFAKVRYHGTVVHEEGDWPPEVEAEVRGAIKDR
jgi:predicted small metal-binding protein